MSERGDGVILSFGRSAIKGLTGRELKRAQVTQERMTCRAKLLIPQIQNWRLSWVMHTWVPACKNRWCTSVTSRAESLLALGKITGYRIPSERCSPKASLPPTLRIPSSTKGYKRTKGCWAASCFPPNKVQRVSLKNLDCSCRIKNLTALARSEFC